MWVDGEVKASQPVGGDGERARVSCGHNVMSVTETLWRKWANLSKTSGAPMNTDDSLLFSLYLRPPDPHMHAGRGAVVAAPSARRPPPKDEFLSPSFFSFFRKLRFLLQWKTVAGKREMREQDSPSAGSGID